MRVPARSGRVIISSAGVRANDIRQFARQVVATGDKARCRIWCGGVVVDAEADQASDDFPRSPSRPSTL